MLEKRQAFTFVWGFSPNDTPSLKPCTPVNITVGRDAQNGSTQPSVPPYTIIAYPDQGVPTVDLLGAGPDLVWTPRIPAGRSVLLTVVDAVGTSGGVAQQMYTVGSSVSDACLPPAPNNDLRATIDGVSGTLNTCDTLPIRIQGGTKPYTVTIARTNASNTVNVTLSASNDYLQWISRSDPNQSLIAAVSDSTGQYAATTQVFRTGGSTDTTCPGLSDSQSVFGGNNDSTGGGSSPTSATHGSPSTTSTPSNGGEKGSNTSLTGAIIGTILGLLAVLGVIAYIFFKKRNARNKYGGDSITGGGGGGGFGMKDYKTGGNLPGNESFLPLRDADQPVTPVLSDSQLYAPRRQSNMDYYSSPPTNYSGTAPSVGTSAVGSGSGPSYSSMSPPSAAGTALGAMGAVGVAGHPQSKREMIAAEQERRQQWNAAHPPQVRPESHYPAASAYSVNPFGDNTYPYNPAAPGGQQQPPHSHAPTGSFGTAYATRPGSSPGPYQPSHVGTGVVAPSAAGRPSGSQDLTTMSSGTGTGSTGSRPGSTTVGLTPAARAKAAEAAQERRAYADEDDELLAYTQPRMLLGVTNPDRASVATTNTTASADPYGGMAAHAAPGTPRPGATMTGAAQVFQHEDAGGVVELPPAYREFSRTPAPGGGPPQL